MIDFDLIIISHNNKELTNQALQSVLKSTIIPQKIILVDNGSTDGTVEFIKERFLNVQIIKNEKNFGYSHAVNQGVKESTSHIVIVSNNDVIIKDDVFATIITDFEFNSKIGVLGVLQRYPNGKRQHSFGVIPGIFSAIRELFFLESLKNKIILTFFKFFRKKPLRVGYVDGAFIAIRREAYQSVGGFDENFFFYFEESDFCKRVKDEGWLVCVDLYSEIIHYRGQYSNNKTGLERSRIKLFIESLNKYSIKHFTCIERKVFLIVKFLEYLFTAVLKKLHYYITRREESNIISKLKSCLASGVLQILKNHSYFDF